MLHSLDLFCCAPKIIKHSEDTEVFGTDSVKWLCRHRTQENKILLTFSKLTMILLEKVNVAKRRGLEKSLPTKVPTVPIFNCSNQQLFCLTWKKGFCGQCLYEHAGQQQKMDQHKMQLNTDVCCLPLKFRTTWSDLAYEGCMWLDWGYEKRKASGWKNWVLNIGRRRMWSLPKSDWVRQAKHLLEDKLNQYC